MLKGENLFLIISYLNISATLILIYLVYKIAKMYAMRWSLPPGPIPIPMLGNLLFFRGTKEHWTIELSKIREEYGNLFTFWLGSTPLVFICDVEVGRDAFRKVDFEGRPANILGDLFYKDDTFGFGTKKGSLCNSLRKLCISATMKYSTSDKMVYLVSDSVDKSFDKIIKCEGSNNPFDISKYIQDLTIDIIATSTFCRGNENDLTDSERKDVNYLLTQFWHKESRQLALMDSLPFLKYFLKYKQFKQNINRFTNWIEKRFLDHYRDYDNSLIRDFCDSLICAKNDALSEGKDVENYLTDGNCAMSIVDLFIGTETTQTTLLWLILLMYFHKPIEKKLRQEIEAEIGDRIPTHEDRNRCHYVMAFISETLRARNSAPVGLWHMTMNNTTIGEYSIPQGQRVFLFQSNILNNEQYWENPKQFNPDRFIVDDKYNVSHAKGYIPFGVGRRVCAGEKLALADLFLVFVRFIQKTNEYNIQLFSDSGIDADPDNYLTLSTQKYELIIKN